MDLTSQLDALELMRFGALPSRAGAPARVVGDTARWRAFVARDSARVVAGGIAFLGERVGYLAGAATLPSHRQRGAQSAIMAARIAAAQSAGCALTSTETGELRAGETNHSYRNMQRAGFHESVVIANFAPPGTTWS